MPRSAFDLAAEDLHARQRELEAASRRRAPEGIWPDQMPKHIRAKPEKDHDPERD